MRLREQREDPANRTELAGERELAEEQRVLEEVRWACPARGEERDGDREVEARAPLRKIRWREVQDDVLQGKHEARLGDRRPDPDAALAHRRFR